MLKLLKRNANSWLELALGRAPMELQSTLQVRLTGWNSVTWTQEIQKYLSVSQSAASLGTSELGASVAERFGKGVAPLNRHLRGSNKLTGMALHRLMASVVSLSSISESPVDGAKSLASQIAIKGYYAGEAAGIRLSHCEHH